MPLTKSPGDQLNSPTRQSTVSFSSSKGGAVFKESELKREELRKARILESSKEVLERASAAQKNADNASKEYKDLARRFGVEPEDV